MKLTNLHGVEPFTTLDGSEIREVAGIPSGNAVNQSLAEATLPPGGQTQEHFHRNSEEIYFFTHGLGRLRVGEEAREVEPGDTVVNRPRAAPQALEHGLRTPAAAVLLRAGLLPRGHRSHGVGWAAMAAAPFPLEPERQALLVVDMQNDFVRPGAPQEVPDARVTIPVIAELLDAFRAAGRPVVFTRFSAGPQRTLLWSWSPQCGPQLRSCWPGVSRVYDDGEELLGHDVVPELAPLDGETVVDKYGYGSFHNTMLEDVLHARAVTQVVAVGTVTQICVEETVREGFHRGLEMVMVRDAVSSFDPELHRATLRNIEMKFGRVEAAATVLAALNPKPSGQVPTHDRWNAGPAT